MGGGGTTFAVIPTDSVSVPLVANTLIVSLPVAVPGAALTFRVTVPLLLRLEGLNDAFTPKGRPETPKFTGLDRLVLTVSVIKYVADCPCHTV
jgi:hypothetical protein